MTEREPVAGIPTDVVTLYNEKGLGCQFEPRDFTRSRKILHCFFIPGNPGTLHFYLQFFNSLIDTLRSSNKFANYDIIYCHGVGHANHHLTDPNMRNRKSPAEEKKFGLRFQVDHKIDYMETILRKYDSILETVPDEVEVEVMLLGHSIGAWMASDILSRHPQLRKRTKYMIMLMPFMFWSNLPMSHKVKLSTFQLLHPVSHHIVTSSTQSLLYIDPHMRRSLFKLSTGLSDELVSLIADRLLTKRLVQNFYTMGYDEIRDVKKHESRMLNLLGDLAKEHQIDIFAMYTDNDVWAPEGDISLLRKTVPQATVVYSPGLTHAFSLTEQRIQKVCGLLQEHFGGKSFVPEAGYDDRLPASSSKSVQIRSML